MEVKVGGSAKLPDSRALCLMLAISQVTQEGVGLAGAELPTGTLSMYIRVQVVWCERLECLAWEGVCVSESAKSEVREGQNCRGSIRYSTVSARQRRLDQPNCQAPCIRCKSWVHCALCSPVRYHCLPSASPAEQGTSGQKQNGWARRPICEW
ncbi:hypothetical protein LY78DRAFT_478883 [Colletotrichum sublineola]|nr:hypothetical protein LY78DRAFT_478883 [Colletotrichum sublineola]